MSTEATGAAAGETSKRATVRFGVYTQVGDFAGMTVGEVKSKLEAQWGIPKDAEGFNGKVKLNDSDVIPTGSSIEFVRRAGEKGV